MSGGVVAPLVFLPRGKGIDFIVRATRSSQLLLLQVKESVARVNPRSNPVSAGAGRTQSGPLEKVAEDQVYHSMDGGASAISALQAVSFEEAREEEPERPASPGAPVAQEAFVEGAASVESETQLQVTQPVELEVSSQELQPSAQAVVPSGPPTLASSGKPALRRKAPPPPEPLRLRDLKVHFFFIRHSARGSPILALELPIICGSCVISSPSIP